MLRTKPLRPLENSEGQVFLETLVSLPFVVVSVSLLLSLIYSLLAYSLMDHWVYQSSICLAKFKNQHQCRSQLEKRLQPFVFHKTQSLRLYRGRHQIQVVLRSKGPIGRPFRLRSQLSLPLKDL